MCSPGLLRRDTQQIVHICPLAGQRAPLLAGKSGLVVMTNALNIAFELANNEQMDLMVVGGNVRRKSWSLYGPTADR